MTKKNIFLIALVLLLLGLYGYYFTDWFRPEGIQIVHTIRPQSARRSRARQAEPPQGFNISFGLNRKYKVTRIKIVSLSQLETNKYPHAVWHMISDSNSVPIKAFSYGEKVPGMHPSIAGVNEEPLEPNVTYRLFVEAESMKGEHDFKVPPSMAAK